MEEVLGEAEKTITFSACKVYSCCAGSVAVPHFPLHDKRASPRIIGKLTLTGCWTVHLPKAVEQPQRMQSQILQFKLETLE